MLISLMVGVYFSVIFSFSFVSHPIYYCLLLLLSSLDICGLVYMFMGFSWYLVLLCLVYVGGVYILFVFVSVYSPNTFLSSGVYWWWVGAVFVFSVCIFTGCFYNYTDSFREYSHYLCSGFEGFSYILLCLVLILGFVCVSVIVNRKDSFYR
uniref:NADH dehydrogenase subunit 6 n=1 Tax=Apharyngostrigea pipientis TaxID=234879 RepID=A0A8A2HA37_9TREM|nr:NADH dehydrogenase subunit 6 [Apharyngostrigea pipientis]QSV37707.1 NADH dehydrogenase subunit 6 [Apharyngostrigea pipientis]